MADPRGQMKVTADGREYTLFVGMSVLAELQAKHGQDVLNRLDAPEGAAPNWMPDLNIVTDLFMGALSRFHSEDASRWLVDDIIAENTDALTGLMGATMPDAEPAGNVKRPKAASA